MTTNPSMAELLQEAANPEQRDANIWAQCFVEAEGEESKAQALYVKHKMPQPVQPAKGFCPSCTAPCYLDAARCQHCGADFIGGGWKPSLTKPLPGYGAKVYDHNESKVVKTAKSRGIYIILGLFLGWLGIHNFYAGRYAIGACQLVISLLVIGIVISFIWAIFELFIVKIDGAGDPMV